MKLNKKTIIVSACVLLVYVGLMIIASIYDLDISKKLADLKAGEYMSSNIFGRIFETIGEMPVYLIIIFVSSIIIENLRRRKREIVLIMITIIFEFILVFICYYAFRKLFKYLNDHFNFVTKLDWKAEIAYVLFALISSVTINYFSKKYTSNFLNAVMPWAIIVCIMVALSQFITQVVIKIPAGRYRYCTMNTLNDFSHFTPWYKFNGKIVPNQEMLAAGIAKDGMKSFPSGHSCAAATVIVFTSLPMFFSKVDTKIYKIAVCVSVTAYVFIVMISRIIMGKHFLSDVLTGAFVTIVCYFICLFFGKKLFDDKLKIQAI